MQLPPELAELVAGRDEKEADPRKRKKAVYEEINKREQEREGKIDKREEEREGKIEKRE